MAAPSHRILRQVIEIACTSAAEAPGLQSALRETYFRDLLPAIDDALSARAVPGQVQRIDRLEIDLGRVPGAVLDAAGLARFKADLGARVAAAIDGAAPADSDLELWLHFLETGSLPWWANGADPRLPALTLTRLLARPQRQWLPALRHLVGAKSGMPAAPSAALRRLARAFADEPLHALLAAALSELPGGAAGASVRSSSDASVGELTALTAASLALLARLRQGTDSPTRLRALWWEQLLGAVLAPGASPWAQLLPGVFDRIAGELGRERRQLAQALREQLAERPVGGPLPAALCRALGLVEADLSAAQAAQPGPGGEAGRIAAARLSALFASWQGRRGGAAAELWGALTVAVPRLPPGLALRWQGPAASVGQPAIDAVAALVEAALRHGLVSPATLQRFAAAAPVGNAISAAPPQTIPGWPADAVAALRARLRAVEGTSPDLPPAGAQPLAAAAAQAGPGRRAPVDPRFSDTDSLYIDNAGLVVLWPFLGNLFQRLGLVESGAFKSEAAAMRAVGLLQLLALGDASPPEFALPLNKLLCGLAVDAVFDFGEPVTELEAEECAAMLVAAISRAPILREMSVAGFRASFVLRRGQLSARDGHWLLRVERETHDIVLDRFPWGVGLVKLPWMPALLQVEW